MSARFHTRSRWVITHAGWLVPGSTVVTPWLAARGNPARTRGVDELEEFFATPLKWERRRPGLFHPVWLDLATGRRWRATRLELRRAYRLWARHRDIRIGRDDA
jgi:hypothetical protein